MIANKIGIIGCGWLGTHLALHLKKNFNLLVTTTNEQKKTNLEQLGLETFVINFFDDKISDSSSLLHPSILHDTDCIIITIPFSKRANINQLKCRFQNLCNSIKGFQKQIFVMSSIGIYPDKDDAIITENSLEDKELNPNILLVENLMQSYFPQVNILRLGGLMGGNRNLRNYQITEPYKVVNHIHYEDICLIIEKMIRNNINSKLYNIVAPIHPTKQEIINIKTNPTISRYGKIISSLLVEKELKYSFKHPNPIFFG